MIRSQELDHNFFSKSYVYLAKGLSDEIERNNIEDSQIINYNSIFFENDIELEEYKQNIKDALTVQLQKEINISHVEIKEQYNAWLAKWQ